MANPDLIQNEQISIGRSGFVEPIYNANNQPINIIEWDSAAKNFKLSEEIITYTNGIATNAVAKTYLSDGSVVQTITELPSYTGGILDNLTITET
jgi:hypothetical protein